MKWKIIIILIMIGVFSKQVHADHEVFIVTNETNIPTNATHSNGTSVTSIVNESDNVSVNIFKNEYVQANDWNQEFLTDEGINLTDLWFGCEIENSVDADLQMEYNYDGTWNNCRTELNAVDGTYECNLYDLGVNNTTRFNNLKTRCTSTDEDFDVDYMFLKNSHTHLKFNSTCNATILEKNSSLETEAIYINETGHLIKNTTTFVLTHDNNVFGNVEIEGVNYSLDFSNETSSFFGTNYYNNSFNWSYGQLNHTVYFESIQYDDCSYNYSETIPELETSQENATFTFDDGLVTVNKTYSFNNSNRTVFFGDVPNTTKNSVLNGLNVSVILEVDSTTNYSLDWVESSNNGTHFSGYWLLENQSISYGNHNYTIYSGGGGVIDLTESGNFSVVQETNLIVDFENDPFFIYNENNLITANYSKVNDSLPVLNATCQIFVTDPDNINETANMTYNNTTTFYEVNFVPDKNGEWELTINCSRPPVIQPQTETQTFQATPFVTTPKEVSFQIWEDLNQTTRFKDEFSWIILEGTDSQIECKGLNNPSDRCFYHSEYIDGFGNVTLYVDDANYTVYYYSGRVNWHDQFSSPQRETFNDFVLLGDLQISTDNPYEDEIHFYANPFEFGYWTGFKGFMKTWGVTIIGVIGVLILAFMFFKIGGGTGFVGALIVSLLTLWLKIRGVI